MQFIEQFYKAPFECQDNIGGARLESILRLYLFGDKIGVSSPLPLLFSFSSIKILEV
jgi:hypothetical protein